MTQPRLNLNSSTYKEELDAATVVIHELRLQLTASQAREDAYRADVAKLSGELAAKDAEITKARFENQIKYGSSHPEMYKSEHEVQLERQLAERDADSARYRWLRAQNELLQDDAFVVLSKDSPLCSCCESSWVGADLDSAIDKELGK